MKHSLRSYFFGLPISLMMAVCGHAAQGPSSSETPYLTPANGTVEFTSLLTVGDVVRKNNPSTPADTVYRMVGIPDGLGAFDNGDGTITVLMNHELGSSQGAVRAHGSAGAFVSKYRIRKSDLKVLRGEDQIKSVYLFNAGTGTWSKGTTAFNRFCSADLAPASAFYNLATDKGYFDGRIFMNGEESGPTGRAFAHIASGPLAGNSYELPSLGTAAWENNVASPGSQDNTIVISMDDTTPGKVYVHGAAKTKDAGPLAAGLNGGLNMNIAVSGYAVDVRDSVPAAGTRFSLVPTSDAAGTKFLRPEDGSWDTRNPNRFYFATTDRYDAVKDGAGTAIGRSRLWRLTFDDVANPLLGGTIEAVLDGTEAGNMFDNLTVDASGNVFLQEDVGGNPHNGKIWKYDPVTDALTLVASHDVARFGDLAIPATAPHNNDEESSGIIEVSHLFAGVPGYDTTTYGYFLLDVQAHSNLADLELVQRGQLLMMRVAK
ncbi:MAG TPA: hypothetical protein VJ385_05320 [Fibrobacteria bacterium]|nr:hypothetical protein [Fibrobacteria bacterium]